MKHVFKKGKNVDSPTLLLLHGTGGDERDLLPLAGLIDPEAAVLSPRGNVLESGMPRFFKRLAEGIFDEEDLIFRTQELMNFIHEASITYGLDRNNIIAVGYSNGANIASSLLFHHKDALRGAILCHPMVPRRGVALPSLSGIPVFITAGTNDSICPKEESLELQQLLQNAGAEIKLHWEHRGHQLTRAEVEAAAHWYRSVFK